METKSGASLLFLFVPELGLGLALAHHYRSNSTAPGKSSLQIGPEISIPLLLFWALVLQNFLIATRFEVIVYFHYWPLYLCVATEKN
jgi:hypothetical protein